MYFGLSTDEPEIAIILSGSYLPFKIALPIITRSGKFKVHTTSPLLIGDILLIIVLKLPEGCGPETLQMLILFNSLKKL